MPAIESERWVRYGGAPALRVSDAPEDHRDVVAFRADCLVKLGRCTMPKQIWLSFLAAGALISCASSSGSPAGEYDDVDDPFLLADTQQERDFLCDELLVSALLEPWTECGLATGVGTIPGRYGEFIRNCHTQVEERFDLLSGTCTFRDAYDCYFLELEYACGGVVDQELGDAGRECLNTPHTECSLIRVP